MLRTTEEVLRPPKSCDLCGNDLALPLLYKVALNSSYGSMCSYVWIKLQMPRGLFETGSHSTAWLQTKLALNPPTVILLLCLLNSRVIGMNHYTRHPFFVLCFIKF